MDTLGYLKPIVSEEDSNYKVETVMDGTHTYTSIISSAPEVVEVPIDTYNKVLEELKLRYDDLIQFRDPQILNVLSDLIKDFENCK